MSMRHVFDRWKYSGITNRLGRRGANGSGAWSGWWVYWVGPLLGTLLGVALFRIGGPRWLTIEIAKLYHFGHDRYGVLRPGDNSVEPGDQGGPS